MAEVFAWPEANIYLFANGVTDQTALTFAQNVRLEETTEWSTVKTMATGSQAARTQYNLRNRYYTLSVGMLYGDQSAFAMVNSATAYNARIGFTYGQGSNFLLLEDGSFILLEDGSKLILDTNNGGFIIYSGVFTRWALQGQDNGLWSTPVEMRAPDISGLS